jgi:hypothetical protein
MGMIEIKRRGQPAAGRPPGRAQRPQDGLRARKVEDYTPKARASTTVNSGPFTGFEAGRDYRSQYRIAFDLHQRYNPPPPPLGDLARFDADAARAMEASGDDPFLAALLQAIRAELIREAKAAAAREIIERHTPPRMEDAERYWNEVLDDLTSAAGHFDDGDLAVQVYEALEAQYKAAEQGL